MTLVRCAMCGLTREVDGEQADNIPTVDHENLIDCVAALRYALRKAIRRHVGVEVDAG